MINTALMPGGCAAIRGIARQAAQEIQAHVDRYGCGGRGPGSGDDALIRMAREGNEVDRVVIRTVRHAADEAHMINRRNELRFSGLKVLSCIQGPIGFMLAGVGMSMAATPSVNPIPGGADAEAGKTGTAFWEAIHEHGRDSAEKTLADSVFSLTRSGMFTPRAIRVLQHEGFKMIVGGETASPLTFHNPTGLPQTRAELQRLLIERASASPLLKDASAPFPTYETWLM